ncbi:MAG: ammonia-forming cytochrome c nitrite reductase subunit c552 [Acidobacteria bacterium]|nr:MAG: ammonia-forming cytochrome c nitrite reductase subunit c552 [Acidobacteriota bacterium]
MNTPTLDVEPRRSRKLLIIVIALAAVATLAVTALLINIFERKQEAKNPFYEVVDLNDTIDDPAVWAKNFPFQYDLYKRTVDMQRTKYGGSEAMPHSPTEADPRSVVARSKLEEDPRLKTIWAGYAFSADYRERRGHAYMLEDQTFTERQKFNPPAMCINCHASLVTTFLKLGDGDLMKGFNVISNTHMTYAQIRQYVKHPVACIDCHDPQTMQLRITRPAFIEGIRALKASQGVLNYDVKTMATRQEMRSYVCGQCHVTYYFQPSNKRLTYPWAKGLKVEDVIAVEDDGKIKEWEHPDSGAELIKARHPEFEMWNQGVHARSGVACADCHMPYMRQGGLKISDHQINSPLLKVNRSCQTCHHFPEEELKARVEDIQDRFFDLRNTALDALVDLINDIKAQKAKGAPDAQLAAARAYQRNGQFMIDFVMSENSMGFHAPQEALRILGDAINLCRLGQVILHGGPPPSHNPPNIKNVSLSSEAASATTTPTK